MFSMTAYLLGLGVALLAAICTWTLSLYKRNVSIVDSLWSLMFILMACVYAVGVPRSLAPRAILVLTLVLIWGLRLSIHITWRNWGHGEDPRYQVIRARNEPNFAWKSLYLVFVLQALLAWIISLPLLGSLLSDRAFGPIDVAGVLLWLLGIVFEGVGDWRRTQAGICGLRGSHESVFFPGRQNSATILCRAAESAATRQSFKKSSSSAPI